MQRGLRLSEKGSARLKAADLRQKHRLPPILEIAILPPVSRAELRLGICQEHAEPMNEPLLFQRMVCRAAAAASFVLACSAVLQAAPAEPPITIQLTWGGGTSQTWSGWIRIVHQKAAADDRQRKAAGSADVVGPPEVLGLVDLRWQPLCVEPDALATMHAEGHTLWVHQSHSTNSSGVELAVENWRDARLELQLIPNGRADAATSLEMSVAELISTQKQQALDTDGNRLTVRRADSDLLRVVFESETPQRSDAASVAPTLKKPGDLVRFWVYPLLPARATHLGAIELRLRLKNSARAEDIHSEAILLKAVSLAEGNDSPAIDRGPVAFEPVAFEVAVPTREGAYDIELEVMERGGLRWTRSLTARTLQVVAVGDLPPNPLPEGRPEAGWKVIYELDPGSPRLHERLRRMPGIGLPSVPNLSMPLPSMGLPAIPRPLLPQVALPRMPAVGLPTMSLPTVASMVPRLSGLLASGHSKVEAHPLGPMLRLPPARSSSEPSWEGIVIAAVQAGLPHRVEIDYPNNQNAVFGVTVLEVNAAGSVVESRHSGGFRVCHPVVEELQPPGLARHSFVFWPSTKNPLLLISNPSSQGGAMFGPIRISAGPLRLPALEASGMRVATASELISKRRVHAYLPSDDIFEFAAADRCDPASGQSVVDWQATLAGIERSAQWLASEGIGGAMVGVYDEGRALWPSKLGIDARGHKNPAVFENSLDPLPKDVLAVLCRIYARENLRVVPALSFNAPLPELEKILNSLPADAAGIACLGRDGKPRRITGKASMIHYNILDPRVQQAALRVVGEVAERVARSPAVDGLAVVVPHDGWTHLPGVAWGLDDLTFNRFMQSVTVPGASAGLLDSPPLPSGEDRFAARALLVEGPLREPWLNWRVAQVAAFHARLADTLAACDRRLCLFVVPTTLFSQGDLAIRFRPTLSPEPSDADPLRDVGIDPGAITAHRGIVYVSPHVHSGADTLLEQSSIHHANCSLSIVRSTARAARRGVVCLQQPLALDVKEILPHGPFGSATSKGRIAIHAVATGAARNRSLAESFVASDVEVVFDASLCYAQSENVNVAANSALESLPPQTMAVVENLPAPLVVRVGDGESGTWITVVNAGGVPCRAVLALDGRPSTTVDAADGAQVPLDAAGGVNVALEAWGVRSLVVDGQRNVRGAEVRFAESVKPSIEQKLARVRQRRAVFEMPLPLKVLDNPSFDLPSLAGTVTGWELVESKRGTLSLSTEAGQGGRQGVVFSSINGLSTVRSNPFEPPVTGRISLAVRLRVPGGGPQPPLRLALEGVENDKEYYRFAAIGGLAGGKPLEDTWSQFVLQVDDLPAHGLESLRVRFDLLGPGSVQIDDVRLFDLAFDESQRVTLSKTIALFESHLAADDLGACVLDLDSHWLRFLERYISDQAVELAVQAARSEPAGAADTAIPAAERSGSLIDRMRRWWQ